MSLEISDFLKALVIKVRKRNKSSSPSLYFKNLTLDETTKSVLCVPVVTPDDDCYAIIELCRDVTQPVFGKEDLKIVVVVSGWVGAAIHQNQQRLALQKQQELNDYLLNLAKCYFAETVKREKMVAEIIVCFSFL